MNHLAGSRRDLLVVQRYEDVLCVPAVDPVAAPLLGEHTREILSETLLYTEERIAALARLGAFGKAGQPAVAAEVGEGG